MLRKAIILMASLALTGCEEGDSRMPLPRQICTQVTNVYSCGRGSVCEQCGNWQIGCPTPLELRQQSGASGPYLACRMKETSNASAISPEAAPIR